MELETVTLSDITQTPQDKHYVLNSYLWMLALESAAMTVSFGISIEVDGLLIPKYLV